LFSPPPFLGWCALSASGLVLALARPLQPFACPPPPSPLARLAPPQGDNDCGVASDAVFAKVADSAVVPGAQARAAELGLARGRALQELEERRADERLRARAAALAAAGPLAASRR
jgi:hypothetical protein